MIRLPLLLIALLALGACRSETALVSQATPTASFAANNGDTRAAKPLFGAIQTPSSQPSEALGFYSRGCQAGAVALPETGPTWQAMRLSRNRNWGQPILLDYIQDLSQFAATQPGWAGLYVGDMSQPRGGPMLTGHASHQSGLDVDIWMLPPSRLNLTRAEREEISSISTQRAEGAYVNSSWTPQHEAIIRQAASDPRVDRIFVFAGAKVALCDSATGDRSWLNKVRPWYGHHFHFHVRLTCPAGDRTCEGQAPIPPGDGCDDARQWVSNILNPPPPDPNAPPPTPSREVTMASLPAQCTDVLNSN
jgi:penicillin-insensitive murein DD-endopeptidase